jgi:hypothetical protein
VSAFKTWRAPTVEEFPFGISELGKIIGEVEAVGPTWTRRLVRAEPSGEWCLLVDEAAQPTMPTLAPWADEVQTRAFPTAYALTEAVKILQGPNNPEAILADRRARVAAHEAELVAEKADAQAKAEAQRVEAAQLDADKARFNFDGWAKLETWQQGFYGLAVLVRDRDPDLAANLRTIASEGRSSKPARPGFPRCDWER